MGLSLYYDQVQTNMYMEPNLSAIISVDNNGRGLCERYTGDIIIIDRLNELLFRPDFNIEIYSHWFLL